jgi:hypothetical protein
MKLSHLFESTSGGTDWSECWKNPTGNDVSSLISSEFVLSKDEGFLGLLFAHVQDLVIKFDSQRTINGWSTDTVSLNSICYDGSDMGHFLFTQTETLKGLYQQNKEITDEESAEDFQDKVEDFAGKIIKHRIEIAAKLFGMTQKQLFGSLPSTTGGLSRKLMEMFLMLREHKQVLVHESDELKVYKIMPGHAKIVTNIVEKKFGDNVSFSWYDFRSEFGFGICINQGDAVHTYDLSKSEYITYTKFYTVQINHKPKIMRGQYQFKTVADLKKFDSVHCEHVVDFAKSIKSDFKLTEFGHPRGPSVFLGLVPDSAFSDYIKRISIKMESYTLSRLEELEESQGFKFDDINKIAEFFADRSRKTKLLTAIKSVIKSGNTGMFEKGLKSFMTELAAKQGFSAHDLSSVNHYINTCFGY